jgi:hypothetical protein
MARRGAMLRVSAAVLKDALRLPENWRVIRIVPPTLPEYDDAITLIVTGDDLPDVPVGQILPELDVIYTRHQDGTITATFDARGVTRR